MNNLPLVSVLVRTCGRPKVLKECLESIRNQTYKNIEICVVEDGKNVSEDLIRHKFPDCNIKYKALGQKQGRSVAGNLALSMATGKYFNFLDDDDLFYENHIEILMDAAQKHPEHSLFYAKADEAVVHVHNTDPYVYEIEKISQHIFGLFSKENLLAHNLFPIQSVLFKREVYDSFGGFRTDLDYLEDWELWLKYAQKYNYYPVPQSTSIFKIPADSHIAEERRERMCSNEEEIRKQYMMRLGITLKSQAAHNGELNKRSKQSRKLRYCIDNLNVFKNGLLQVEGWAFLEGVSLDATEIYVRITDKKNDKFFAPVLQYSRPDVAERFDDKKLSNCGFIVSCSDFGLKNLDDIKHADVVAYANNKLYANNMLFTKKRFAAYLEKVGLKRR